MKPEDLEKNKYSKVSKTQRIFDFLGEVIAYLLIFMICGGSVLTVGHGIAYIISLGLVKEIFLVLFGGSLIFSLLFILYNRLNKKSNSKESNNEYDRSNREN